MSAEPVQGTARRAPGDLWDLFGVTGPRVHWLRVFLIFAAYAATSVIHRLAWPVVDAVLEGRLEELLSDSSSLWSFWLWLQLVTTALVAVGLLTAALTVTKRLWVVVVAFGLCFPLLQTAIRVPLMRAYYSAEFAGDPETLEELLTNLSTAYWSPKSLLLVMAFAVFFAVGLALVKWIRPPWLGLLIGLGGAQLLTSAGWLVTDWPNAKDLVLQEVIGSVIWALSLTLLLLAAFKLSPRSLSEPGEPDVDAAAEEGVDPALVGIRGWLVLPAIGFVLGALFRVAGLVLGAIVFEDVRASGFGGLWSLELLIQAIMLIFLIYTASLFFGRKKSAPTVVIAFLAIDLALGFLVLLIELAAGADEFAAESGKQLVRGVIGAAIWIPYFRVSKRVRATFVRSGGWEPEARRPMTRDGRECSGCGQLLKEFHTRCFQCGREVRSQKVTD